MLLQHFLAQRSIGDFLINVGAYLGAANAELATRLTDQELIRPMFRSNFRNEGYEGKDDEKCVYQYDSKILYWYQRSIWVILFFPDEWIERYSSYYCRSGIVADVSYAGPETIPPHMVEFSKGRPLHLAHANAAGCGTHADAVDGMQQIIDLCRLPNVTGEFVATMLKRKGLGSREGLHMTTSSRQVALDALADGTVNMLVSDGENHSTMKGFGDTRDNIPCILELAKEGVVGVMDAVCYHDLQIRQNTLSKITGCTEWKEKFGNLKSGSWANITVVDPEDQLATYVMTGGNLTSFENRYL